MKFISGYYKRLRIRKLKIAILAVLVSIFFLPSYTTFESTGDNMFTVFLNGEKVGTVGSKADAEKYALEARRQIAADSQELVLVEYDITLEGSEILWGEVDEKEQVISNMAMVLADNVRETMNRSYVVKINDFMVNLASKNEVTALLQAAIDKYDSEGKYIVELQQDPTRELPVLTTNVLSTQEARELEEEAETVSFEAGIEAEISEVFAQVEPDVEKDFEDYDLGLISMGFGDTIEVVEAYLQAEELTDLNKAIEEVTKEQEKNEIYEVVSGDTLSEISIKTNIPLDKLIELNETLEDENSTIRVAMN